MAPEDWDRVPYPPEQWVEEWRDAVMTNRLDEVTPLVEDALAGRELAVQPASPAWQMLCRMSLIVASRAHAINARREWGNYEDGWPQAAGIPVAEPPGAPHPRETTVPLPAADPEPASDPASATAVGPLISESSAGLLEARPDWSEDYREHVQQTLALLVSLIGDLPVRQITGEVAETFRNRLKNLPTGRGTGIYAGMSALQAVLTAERLRAALQEPGKTVSWARSLSHGSVQRR